jgi:hypothetical protein
MKKLYYIALLSFMLASPLLAFWSGTERDQIISEDDNMMGWYTRMAVDSNGKIHVVWNERIVNLPSQQEIHYSSSTDNGRTWSAMSGDIVISYNDGVNAENGSAIAVDSEDNLYVVWSEADAGYKEIHYSISADGGATWSGRTADHILSYPGPNDANNPAMAIDHNDVIHIVWNQTWSSGTAEICYSRSTDGGSSWSSQTAESIISYPDGQAASYPDIAVGPNNEIAVVFKENHDTSSTYNVINITMSTDGGLTWTGTTTDHPVSRAIRIAQYPHVKIDPDGNIHVNWQGTQNIVSPFHYEMFYSRSTDGGNTWSGLATDRIISYYQEGGGSVSNPNLGMDHCGDLFAVWDEYYTGTTNEIHISTSTDAGVTWSGENQDEIISFPDGHPAYRPFLTAGIDDTLHVTWNEVTNTSYYQIHYSRGDAACIPSAEPIDDLTIQKVSNHAVLNWNALPNAVGYKIYRSSDPSFIPSPADSLDYTTTNSYTDTNVMINNNAKFYNVIVVY